MKTLKEIANENGWNLFKSQRIAKGIQPDKRAGNIRLYDTEKELQIVRIGKTDLRYKENKTSRPVTLA